MRGLASGAWMLAGLLGLALLPAAANAHSFTVAVVVPLSGSDALRGKRMMEGFLLATRERDAHAAEESDGHLGGLDSYVVPIDASQGRGPVVARLREMDADRTPAFVTGLFPRPDEAIAGLVRATGPAVFVDPARSQSYERSIRQPAALATMNGGSFAAAYRAAYGQAPDADAVHGYLAARLINLTVRAVQEDLGRRETVTEALEDATAKRL